MMCLCEPVVLMILGSLVVAVVAAGAYRRVPQNPYWI